MDYIDEESSDEESSDEESSDEESSDDDFSQYKLDEAARLGDIDKFHMLFESGGELDDKTLQGPSQNGHIDIVLFILENSNNISIAGKNNALGRSIDSGYIDIFRLLLKHGANINNNSYKRVVASGNVEMVQYVLDFGGVISEELLYEMLRISTNNNYTGIIQLLLLENEVSQETLNDMLMISPSRDTSQLLLDNGAELFDYYPREIVGLHGVRIYYRDLNTELAPSKVRSLGITLKDDEAIYATSFFREAGRKRPETEKDLLKNVEQITEKYPNEKYSERVRRANLGIPGYTYPELSREIGKYLFVKKRKSKKRKSKKRKSKKRKSKKRKSKKRKSKFR
jgi:hypothetical protein